MKKSVLFIMVLSLAGCALQQDKSLEEEKVAIGLCDRKLDQHLFKKVVQYQTCLNNAGDKYFQDIHNPFLDLVYLQDAHNIKLAEQVDKGQLSVNDFILKKYEYHNYIIHEAQQRTYPLSNVSSSITPHSNSGASEELNSNIIPDNGQSGFGQQVYSSSECIGAIVNGECHGSILPNTAYHETCHGQMLNGQCTGPMF